MQALVQDRFMAQQEAVDSPDKVMHGVKNDRTAKPGTACLNTSGPQVP